MGARKYNGWYKVTKNTRFKKYQKYFIWTKMYGIDVVEYSEWADSSCEDGFKYVSIFNENVVYNLKGVDYWRHPIIGPDGKPC